MCSGYLSPKTLIKGTKALSRFQRKTWTEGLAGANSAQGALPNPGAPSPGPPKGVRGRGAILRCGFGVQGGDGKLR